ncbi:DNA-binding response regulator [Paracoccus tibetensis]|uniref:response regulator transcription factor n=1 Tax=Paracoccus tibetensis TaxID=336292 RepID=UPI001FDFCF9F|nr:DNA-binding response regulator [Paracoccus tibetensis]
MTERAAAQVALVVDDDPASLMMVSDALEAVGITTLTARDGQTALRFAERLAPDIVLLDAMMPGLDGFETCRRLKAPPLSLDAPVIFMTGLTEQSSVVLGLQAGGVDYVTKPLQMDALIARIGVHLVNASRLASAHQALEATGRGVAAFSRDGILTWASAHAQVLLAADPGLLHDGRAAAAFARWLASLSATPLSEAGAHLTPALVVDYLGTTPASDTLVSVSARDQRCPQEILATRFGLTEREAEVLLWVTRGKTSADIGQILGLSWRTVNKHLEMVFQKMGVENRTSAAVLADRALSR